MTDQPIKMDQGAHYRETMGVAMPIGSRLIETKRGMIRATDGPGFSTVMIRHADPTFNRVGLLLYADQPDGVGTGLIAQMTPTEARTIAASLLRLASELDPGKPN